MEQWWMLFTLVSFKLFQRKLWILLFLFWWKGSDKFVHVCIFPNQADEDRHNITNMQNVLEIPALQNNQLEWVWFQVYDELFFPVYWLT